MINEINSKQYWNCRFQSGDWEQYDGDKQSVFFYTLACTAMSEPLRTDLERNAFHFVDYGCALGDGTAFLAHRFPSCSVTGIDFPMRQFRKPLKSTRNAALRSEISPSLSPKPTLFSLPTRWNICKTRCPSCIRWSALRRSIPSCFCRWKKHQPLPSTLFYFKPICSRHA